MALCPDCGQEADLIDGAHFVCGCVRFSRPRRLWSWMKARWVNLRNTLPVASPDDWDDDVSLIDLIEKD